MYKETVIALVFVAIIVVMLTLASPAWYLK